MVMYCFRAKCQKLQFLEWIDSTDSLVKLSKFTADINVFKKQFWSLQLISPFKATAPLLSMFIQKSQMFVH